MLSLLQFLKQNGRWVFGGFLLTFFSGFGQTFFISLFAADIMDVFQLSNGGWGAIYMIGTLMSAATLIWLGKIVDTRPVAQVSLVTALALAAACLSMSYANGSVILLVLTIFGLRFFGQGMMSHIAITATGRWFSANRGRAVSIVTVGHQGSEALFPISFLLLATTFGWRNAWGLAAIILIIAAPCIYFLMRADRSVENAPFKTTAKNPNPERHWTRAEALRDPWFFALLLAITTPSTFTTAIFFHQVHLMDVKGWQLELFASGFALLAFVAVIFAFISGWLIDRYSALRIGSFFLTPLTLACFALGIFQNPITIIVFMTCVGASYGLASTLIAALLPEIFGTKHLGAIRAIATSAMVFFTAIGPAITGLLIDLDIGIEGQIIFMGVLCILMTVVMMAVMRNYRAASIQPQPY